MMGEPSVDIIDLAGDERTEHVRGLDDGEKMTCAGNGVEMTVAVECIECKECKGCKEVRCGGGQKGADGGSVLLRGIGRISRKLILETPNTASGSTIMR